MIGQLSNIVKRRNSSKRKHQVASLEPCTIRVDEDGLLYIESNGILVPEDAKHRSDVLHHLSTMTEEIVHLPITEAAFLRWLQAVSSNRKGFLGYSAHEFAAVMMAADALADRRTVQDACAAHAVPLRIVLGAVESPVLSPSFDSVFAEAAAADAVARCMPNTVDADWISQVVSSVPEPVALALLHDALCGYRRGIPVPADDLSCRTLPLQLTALQPHLHAIAARACAPCIDALSTLCLHLPDNPNAAVTPTTFLTETLPALSTLTALDFTIPSVSHLRSVEQRETADKRLAALLRAACRMPVLRALTLNLSARAPVPMSRFRRMLPKSLAEAVGLRRLTLVHANLRVDSARHLAAALEKLPLQALEFRSCGVDAAVAAALTPGLAALSELEEIGFCNENLTGYAAAEILRALPRPGQLRRIEFDVALTDVEGGAGEQLAAAIGTATALRELRIDQKGKTLCWGRCGSLQAVAWGLARHSTRSTALTRLELACNGDADIAHACGQLLCHLPELSVLSVHAVPMTAHGAAAFAQGLRRKRHLRSVDLGRCRTDAAGLRVLVGAMHALPALKSANLSGVIETSEMTGWEAAEIIAPAMHDMHALTSLQLSRGTVGSGGMCMVASSFACLRLLRRLDVSGNAMGGEGVRALALAVGGLGALHDLNLSRNKISSSGAVELQGLLPGLSALTYLDISGNPLHCEGARHLARSVWPPTHSAQHSSSHAGRSCAGPGRGTAALQKLKLTDCGIMAAGMKSLATALCALPALRAVAVSDAVAARELDALAAACSAVAVTVDGVHSVR